MRKQPLPRARSRTPKAESPSIQSPAPKAERPSAQRPAPEGQRPSAQRPEPRADSIGLIGLGIMGSAITTSLLGAGYAVVGYDISAARRREHARAGGRAARTAADVGRAADIVICSLPSVSALADVAAALAKKGRGDRIVIETSTLPIPAKLAARRVLSAAGVTMLDCPISGTGAQARSRDLVVLASGPRRAYHRIAPVLEAFARAHHHVGPFGAGSKTKFVANLLVGIHNVAAAEGLVLAMKAGLDPAKTLAIVADGAGGSRMLQVRGPSMVRGDYSNAMNRLSLWAKDLAVISEFASSLGCPTPLFSATIPLYAAALEMGREHEDTAAVCAVLESMAGYRRPSKPGPGRATK